MADPNFFVDECLSPELAHRLAEIGYDAIAARDVGRLGQLDYVVRDRCLREDRVIVTHNARDFRKLVGKVDVHPGLVILAENAKEPSSRLLKAALDRISREPDPRSWMLNRVVEVDAAGNVTDYELPPP